MPPAKSIWKRVLFRKQLHACLKNRWNLSPQTEDRCANCCFPSWRFLCQVHGILHAKRSRHRINGTLVKSPGCHIQQVHPGYGFLKCLAGDTFRDRYFQLNEDLRQRQKYPSREWLRETRFSVFSTYVLLLTVADLLRRAAVSRKSGFRSGVFCDGRDIRTAWRWRGRPGRRWRRPGPDRG